MLLAGRLSSSVGLEFVNVKTLRQCGLSFRPPSYSPQPKSNIPGLTVRAQPDLNISLQMTDTLVVYKRMSSNMHQFMILTRLLMYCSLLPWWPPSM